LEHGLGWSFLGEHKFVSFGVETEGEVDKAVLFFGFADETAAVFKDQIDPFADVIALEAEAGPGSFSFAATMDSDG
jgi:hypothetical protein